MTTYDLKSFQGNSADEIEEINGTVRLQGKWSKFRSVSREVCDHFMTLAAASLLSDMKPELFFQNLHRGAENWRCYLVSSEQHFGHAPPLMYSLPLYAAIVANERALLEGLVEALPKQWQKGEEYRDNFHVCWLHLLLAVNLCKSNDQIDMHLIELQAADADTTKINLFSALLGRNKLQEEDFWSSFDDALFAHEEEVNNRVASSTTNIVQFIPHRYIWFEGVTWLRLALMKGFKLPASNIKFCPDEALGKMHATYLKDWLVIPLP